MAPLKIDMATASEKWTGSGEKARQADRAYAVGSLKEDFLDKLLMTVAPEEDHGGVEDHTAVEVLGKVSTLLKDLRDGGKAAEAYDWWQEAVKLLRPEIEELVQAFEETVFPFNKYNRRRADFKGSQLHLQGLLKVCIFINSARLALLGSLILARRKYGPHPSHLSHSTSFRPMDLTHAT